MKSLAERQISRVIRKAENAFIERIDFSPSRDGIGKIDRRYVAKVEADEIEAATNATIASMSATFPAKG